MSEQQQQKQQQQQQPPTSNHSNESCDRQTINFNQDYTSLSVVGPAGYRLFCVSSVNHVEEIFGSKQEDIKIAERLFSSSLVAVVTTKESTKLKVCHFRKGSEICNYNYPSDILAVRLNRSRMIISLSDAIYMHNIRDMKMLHSIQHQAANPTGLCALSLNSHLAYPVNYGAGGGGGGSDVGVIQIFDCVSLTARMRIKAHESPLAALCFSANGVLVASASEKGTVIRVFSVRNGVRVHEFRRGVKRYVRIASLNFSGCANYLCVSSNTETVHVFRIDQQAVEAAERQNSIEGQPVGAAATATAAVEPTKIAPAATVAAAAAAAAVEDRTPAATTADAATVPASYWSMNYLTKAVTAYFPTQVSDVLSQDRAFATVQLLQAGLRYECVITKLEKETRLLVACEDGFLFIYALDEQRGGECKQVRVHDLRTPLCGVTELDMDLPNGTAIVRSTSPTTTTSVTAPATGGGGQQIETYARALRGGSDSDPMSAESATLRQLHEAIDPPLNIFEGVAFPPVGAALAGVRCD